MKSMKICSKCKTEKELDEFSSNKKKKDGKSSWCKVCVREKSDKHYTQNVEEILLKQKTHNRKNTIKAQEILDLLKEDKYCKKCGYSKYKFVLDFHHIDPKQKDFAISTGGRRNISVLKAEIEKCVVLCSNCHRVFHYLEKQNGITISEYLK